MRRKIDLRVEKTVYESMSDIHFWTTPKGDQPHYSYIFNKPYTLEIKGIRRTGKPHVGSFIYPKIDLSLKIMVLAEQV